jgi:ribosomal protein S14
MTCGEQKYATEFYVRDKKTGRRHSVCKICDRKRVKEQYNAETYRNQHLKRNYGITLNEYNQMLLEQEHRCKICGTTEPGGKYGKFMVDHSHNTGEVRGLLCKSCNIALGEVGDNISTLQKMIEYLNT